MEWEDGKSVVSEKIVRLLFDQMKDAYDRNTQSINSLTSVVNELMKHLTSQNISTEMNLMLDRIKEHEKSCFDRQKEVAKEIQTVIDKSSNGVKGVVEVVKTHDITALEKHERELEYSKDISNCLNNVTKSINDVGDIVKANRSLMQGIKNKIVIILAVISIAVGLAGYLNIIYTRASETAINKAVETIIERNRIVDEKAKPIDKAPTNPGVK